MMSEPLAHRLQASCAQDKDDLHMKKSIWAVCLAALTTGAPQAYATIFSTFTDLAAFQFAAGSLSLEDLGGYPNEPVFFKDLGDFTLTLDNSAIPPEGFYGGPVTIIDEALFVQQCCWWSVLQLTFDSPITALGFDWSNTDNTDSLELIINDLSFVFGPPGQQGFFGVVATEGHFAMAGLSDTTGGGGGLNSGRIDNIRYSNSSPSPIPIPGTVGLFGLALLGLVAVRRKKA
jgi:hypothetical protein